VNTLAWILIAGIAIILYLGLAIISELRQLRVVLTELQGGIAQATWRVRDELTQINKRNGV
jgi:hypothetical protein